MRRINTASKDVDLFGAGKHGWKSAIDSGGVTFGEKGWTNAVQEELCRLAELQVTVALDDPRNGMLADIELCRQLCEAAGVAVVDTSGVAQVTLLVSPTDGDDVFSYQESNQTAIRWGRLDSFADPETEDFGGSALIYGATAKANGDLVLVGGDAGKHKSWVWPAGTTFTVGTPTLTGGTFTSVASDGADVFVTHSDTLDTVYRSTDGLVWSEAASPVTASAHASFAGSSFVLCSSTALYTSADGTTWGVKTHPNSGEEYKFGATVAGRHYFYGVSTFDVHSTTDFTTWNDESVIGEVQQHGAIAAAFGPALTMFTENIGTVVRPLPASGQPSRIYAAGAHRIFLSTSTGVDVRGTFF